MQTVTLFCIFHQDKQDIDHPDARIASDPPQTPEGRLKVLSLVPTIHEYMAVHGPPQFIYTSRMERASGAAGDLAKELDLDFRSVKGLGQHSNLVGGTKTVITYPGYESESYLEWQNNAFKALNFIAECEHKTGFALITAHRPTLGGAIAHCLGIFDSEGIQKVVRDPRIVRRGYVVFESNGQNSLFLSYGSRKILE